MFQKRMHGDSPTSARWQCGHRRIDDRRRRPGQPGRRRQQPGRGLRIRGRGGLQLGEEAHPGRRPLQPGLRPADRPGRRRPGRARRDRPAPPRAAIGDGSVHLFRRVNGAWQFDRMVWPDSGNQITALDADWGGSLALHVRRDANGNETGLWIAVGAPGDSAIDLDGRGDPQQNQTVATHAGTVGGLRQDRRPDRELEPMVHGTLVGRPCRHQPRHARASSTRRTSPLRDASAPASPSPRTARWSSASPARTRSTATTCPGQSDAFSPSYTHRETIAGDANELGKAVAADGTRIVVAGRRGQLVRPHQLLHRRRPQHEPDPGGGVQRRAAGRRADRPRPGRAAPGRRCVRRRCCPGLPADRGRRRCRPGGASRRSRRHAVRRRGGAQPRRSPPQPGRGRDGRRTGTDLGAHEGEATVYIASVTTDGRATWSEAATLAAPLEEQSGGPATSAHEDRAFGTAITNWPDRGGVLVGAPGNDCPDVNTGRAYAFATAALSPPPRPTAFVDVSTPGEVPVGATYIPTDGLAPSLLTNNAQQSGSIAAAAIGGIDLTLPPEGSDVEASPLHSIPLHSIDLDALPDAAKRVLAVPLHTIPLHSIEGGWATLLEGTPFEDATAAERHPARPARRAGVLSQLTSATWPRARCTRSGWPRSRWPACRSTRSRSTRTTRTTRSSSGATHSPTPERTRPRTDSTARARAPPRTHASTIDVTVAARRTPALDPVALDPAARDRSDRFAVALDPVAHDRHRRFAAAQHPALTRSRCTRSRCTPSRCTRSRSHRSRCTRSRCTRSAWPGRRCTRSRCTRSTSPARRCTRFRCTASRCTDDPAAHASRSHSIPLRRSRCTRSRCTRSTWRARRCTRSRSTDRHRGFAVATDPAALDRR